MDTKELLNLALAEPLEYDYSERYRDLVLHAFGFKPEAISFIKAKSTFKVRRLWQKSPPGAIEKIYRHIRYGGIGQGWSPPASYDGIGKIVLGYFQAEGCLHECSHVFYHWRRHEQPELKLALAKELVLLADYGPSLIFFEAVIFARGYVYGIGTWPGMFAEGGRKVADVHRLTEADLPHINDWEIFAGLASFTMGKWRNHVVGTTAKCLLPAGFDRFFDSMLTGQVLVTPYYE